jgi:ubiquinone/menaquinone biosynthesis C-methylase UbiE
MLARALAKPAGRSIDFVLGDVKALPFPDASLDLIMISFATRNINLSREILTRTFAEFRRVLWGALRAIVSSEVPGPGQVTAASLKESEYQGTTLESCLAGSVKLIAFPTFDGDPYTVSYPFRLGS